MAVELQTTPTPEQLSIRQQELELERAKLSVEFAKFGFAGTLSAGIIGLLVVLGLAALSAFTTFKIETWGLVAIAAIVLMGVVAFGFLSLWELPRIVARFQNTQFSINPNEPRK
jgi:Zn-dependent protease with chaperone function